MTYGILILTSSESEVIIFFMLNSVEHEILNAHKYKNIKKFSFFSDSDKPMMLFFLLINVKCHQLLIF